MSTLRVLRVIPPVRPIGCCPPIGFVRTDGRALHRHVRARTSPARRARRCRDSSHAGPVQRLVVQRVVGRGVTPACRARASYLLLSGSFRLYDSRRTVRV
jgi:hypothetical protein